MPFAMIALDADDTLWESEIFYQQSQDALAELVAPYGVDAPALHAALLATELANLPYFGYGIKSFTLSMIETAVEVTGGRVTPQEIRAIVRLGREMERHEVRLLPHAAGALEQLAARYPLMLITKGDLMDQQRKLRDSGLAARFQAVEIVSDKDAETYAGLLHKYRLDAGRFLMVGNAMRSDIQPVLALGGWAVYAPHPLTWSHEGGDAPNGSPRFAQVEHLGQLPDAVAALERRLDEQPGDSADQANQYTF